MAEFLAGLVDKFPIISIEDGMAEDDWEGWKALTDLLGKKIQLVGDDLFVTNTERLREGIKMGVANSILVKVNQIGSLSETLDAVDIAHTRRLHLGDVAPLGRDRGSRRSPTSRSPTNCGQIKTGSLARSDRLAKYNQLIRIEEQLGRRRPSTPAARSCAADRRAVWGGAEDRGGGELPASRASCLLVRLCDPIMTGRLTPSTAR